MITDGKAKREQDTCRVGYSCSRLAEKWLKDCGIRQTALDAIVKEQFVEVLLDKVRV